LRYTADITVDPATFQTLKESVAVLNTGPPAAAGELTMFGTPIRRGDRTVVEFTIEASDEREILEAVKTARAAAEIVVVSLHSHEPSNAVEQPADFVMRFARAAIDAGAAIVAGHGPHRLRGVEMYRHGAILYSLGNFLYQTAGLDFRAANLYDKGANLYQAAVGGLGEPPRAVAAPPGADEWWEGLLALATVDQGRVNEIRLYPLDLGVDKPLSERGIPRIARGTQAERILTRLRQASDSFPARVEAEPETGTVRVVSPITSSP
jgi:poly-gamma-glutamate synthesis protein (capsule biosynthesis protein)